jgi:hypothetical protein
MPKPFLISLLVSTFLSPSPGVARTDVAENMKRLVRASR